MRRAETSVVIERPLNEVFAYIIEPGNMPQWAPGYLESELISEGPIRAGATLRRVTNFSGRRAESEHIVKEFEPNVRISVLTKSGPLEIEEIFEVQVVEGGTQVTIAEEVVAPLVVKPVEWVFAFMAGKNIPKYGDALKAQLEKS